LRFNMGSMAHACRSESAGRLGLKLPLVITWILRAMDVTVQKETFRSLGDFCELPKHQRYDAAQNEAMKLVEHVGKGVGSQIIDAVRAQTVLVRAAADSIIIDGPTNLARLTQDPTVYSLLAAKGSNQSAGTFVRLPT
jgi:hypothetical protein